MGHVPRSMTLYLYGETTRSCSAGDVITTSGIFLPTPFTGRGNRNGMITDTYLEVMCLEKHKKT